MRKELGMHYNIHYSKVNSTFHGERKLLKRMVTQPGFEPGAYCLGGSRSILLSYWVVRSS